MKKRLLYISAYDPHVPYSGACVRGGEFVTNLANHFDIDLIYMEGSGHPGDKELESKFEWRVKGVSTKVKISFSRKNYFLYCNRMLAKAEKLILKYRHDVVLTDYGLSAIYGIKLKKKYRIPFVFCSHNIEFKQYWGKVKNDPRRLVLIPWIYSVEKGGVKKSDLLVPISEADANFYTRWKKKNRMFVVPQGFNEKQFNPFYDPPKNEIKKILFVGNYNISTNRDAVHAVRDYIVKQVVAQYPSVVFQFIGKNPPRYIQHPNMEFIGFVEHLEKYLKNCDVIISPILAGWGMPTKIIESLACGKPIVATKEACRTIQKKYKTLNVVDIKDFPNAILAALKREIPVESVDFELLKQEFNWKIALDQLAEHIKAII